MALLSRGLIPSEDNFRLAYRQVVGDENLPFEVSNGLFDELLDDLVLQDALEEAGIEREPLTDGKEATELELDCDQLYALVDVLNEMFLDGDEEAGQANAALLERLGFTVV